MLTKSPYFKPSKFTCNKDIFLEAEKIVVEGRGVLPSFSGVSEEVQKVVKWIKYFCRVLQLKETQENLLETIYDRLKLEDNFEYNAIAKKVNEIIWFEEEVELSLKYILSQEKYRDIILEAMARFAIMQVVDLNWVIKDVTYCENVNWYSIEELKWQSTKLFTSWKHSPEFYQSIRNTLLSWNIWSGIITNKAKDGRGFHVKKIIIPIINKIWKVVGFVDMWFDISEEQAKLAELEVKARFDNLTWALMRDSFDSLAVNKLQEASSMEEELSVVIIDLDYFKNINDTYGHHIWDQVLKEFSLIVKQEIRKNDLFSRYWWEEFVILFPWACIEKAIEISEKIREKLQNHEIKFKHEWKTVTLQITASFGVSDLVTWDNLGSLLKRWDKAMYHAKEQWRNRVYLELWDEESL